jgi:hypothetical protein
VNFGICNPANTPDTSINLDPNEYMDDPNVQPEQEVMRETESSNSIGKRNTKITLGALVIWFCIIAWIAAVYVVILNE